MSKIIIAGAGGAPSENVIKSLQEDKRNEEIVGIGSEPYDLMMSGSVRKYHVPYAIDKSYKKTLIKILNNEKPNLIHFQNDVEILEASKLRRDILETGVKLYMPSHDIIEKCVDKSKSAEIWEKSGIKIPKTILINNELDLKNAFDLLGNNDGEIWIRATVGGGGKGALPTNSYDFARLWIERYKGWGKFTAAELLKPETVTWLSIWYKGELVVAQTRKRKSWNFGNRTLSGVTGITRVGETYSDSIVDRVALDSILSIDNKPHGIYGVDMAYDKDGFPNPTEINISRFFTTVYFFTRAGLNMPKIFKDIVLYNEFPNIDKKLNPLPQGLLWIRGMDREGILTTQKDVKNSIKVVD
ncbi:MAG: hypothetical protein AB6733_05985 [Clostridiaceae bacterium]